MSKHKFASCFMPMLLLVIGGFPSAPASAGSSTSATFQGTGNNRLDACKNAKDHARLYFDGRDAIAKALSRPNSFAISECDCSEEKAYQYITWKCNVEATATPDQLSSRYERQAPPSPRIGMKSTQAKGTSQIDACSNAKWLAPKAVPFGTKFHHYGECQCGVDQFSNGFPHVCLIDVYFEELR